MRKIAYIVPGALLLWAAILPLAHADTLFDNSATGSSYNPGGSIESDFQIAANGSNFNLTQVGVQSCAFYGYSGHPTDITFNFYSDITHLNLLATAHILGYNTCGGVSENDATLSATISLVDNPYVYVSANLNVSPGWNSLINHNVDTSHITYIGGTGDFGILLYGNQPPSDYIDINYPADGATSTSPSISNPFQVNFTTALDFASTSTLHYELAVYLGSTTSTMTSAGDTYVGSNYSNTPLYVNISNYAPLNQNYTYYEQARLIYWSMGVGLGEGELVATSTIKSFTSGAGYAGNPSYYETPTSTATSSQWVITCDPNSGLFSYSICYMGQYLFVPAPGVLTQYTGLWDDIKTKPPMGWFGEIVSTIQSINPSSTPAFVLAAPEIISDFGGIFTLFDVGFGVIFVFLAITWTYHRARNLKL